MGAKTWMLVYADGDVRSVLRASPQLERKAARNMVARLHPGRQISDDPDGTLLENASPPDGVVYAGCFPGLIIICTAEVGGDYPSRLDRRFIDAADGRTVYLQCMHSVIDWFAFGIWKGGTLARALSISPDSGVLENIGGPLPFEEPYWGGKHPVETDPGDDPYPLAFHPLELGENALRALFGFVYEGVPQPDDPDLEAVRLAGFRVSRPSLPDTVAGWFGCGEKNRASPVRPCRSAFGSSPGGALSWCWAGRRQRPHR